MKKEMKSELRGVIEKLQRGEKLSDEAINELDRLLGLLQGQGWSGFITADEALKYVLDERLESWYRR